MQQAIYNNSNLDNTLRIQPAGRMPGAAKSGTRLVRWIARRWEMAGVLTLLGSSAAYAVCALMPA